MIKKITVGLCALFFLSFLSAQSQVSILIDTNISASCTDDGSFVLSPNNLPSGQPYQWDYTSWPASYTGTTASQTNDTFSNLTSGVYTIRLAYIDTGSPFTQFVSRTITVDGYVIDSKDSTVYLNTNGIAYFDTSYFLTYLAPSCVDSVWMSSYEVSCGVDTLSVTVYARDLSGNVDSCTSIALVFDTISPYLSTKDTTVYLDSMGIASYDTSMLIASYDTSMLLGFGEVDSLIYTFGGTAMTVAYNPLKGVYYVLPGGNPSRRIASYQADGTLISDVSAGWDTRGLWWNKNTNQLEGVAYDMGGIRVVDLDPTTGAALGTGTNISLTSSKPNMQSMGSYDYNNDEIIYTTGSVLYRYSRSTHTSLGTVTITGLPGPVNPNFAGYTGIAGSEIAMYDYSNKRIYYVDITTGAYVSTQQLPLSVPGHSTWGVNNANGYMWLWHSSGNYLKGYSLTAGGLSQAVDDNCGLDSVWQDSYDTTCVAAGVAVTVTTFAQDLSGNTTSSTSQVTILDTIVPNVTTVDTLVVYKDASGLASYDTSDLVVSSWDNCTIDSVWNDSYTPSCASDTITIKTFVRDNSGNIDSSETVLIVLDTFPPVIVCHDSVVYLDATGNVSYDTSYFVTSITPLCLDSVWISSTDTNCTTDTIAITIYARDVSGNVDSCETTLAVLDTLLPTIACIDTTVYLDSMGSVTIDTSYVQTGFADNCGVDSVWITDTSFTCNSSRTIQVYVRDNSGNIDSCSSIITVLDTIVPNVVTNDSVYVYKDILGAIATIDTSLLLDSIYENCTIDSVWNDSYTPSCASDTITIKTFVRDNSGNIDSSETVLIVLDTFPPVIVCHDSVVYLDATGNVSYDTSYFVTSITPLCLDSVWISSTDTNCTTDTIAITIYARDVSGNVDSCETTLAVLDTLLPTIACIDTTVYLDSMGSVTIDTSYVQTGFADNCGVDSVWITDTSFTCNSSRTIQVYVRDNSGNIDSCSSIITVLDTIAPNLVAQNKTVYLDATGSVSFDTSAMIVSTHDNCSVDAISMDITSATCADDSVNVTLTITDVNGNSSTTMATVYVLDTIAPTVILANDTLYLDATGNASTSLSEIVNGSNDNCGISSITLSDSVYTCNEAGLNTVTVTVTDNSGNMITESATVLVIDSVNPIAMCKNLTLYLDATGNASLVASDIDNGSSDNCGSVTLSASQTAFTCADLGQTTVSLTVTDTYGNVDSCTSTVTVLDIIAPVALCQPATIYLDASGVATLAASDIDNGSSDNCSVSLSVSQTTFNCSDLGANTVTLTATDSQGLTSTCTTTVTILDTLAPMMVCQSVTVNLDALGNAMISASDLDNGSSDNCSGVSLSLSQTTFSCTDLGANMVTLTGTDASGNTSTCMATVTVVDGINPIALCKPATIYLDSNGDARLVASDIDNGSSDNCSVTVTITDSLFTCSDAGANNVTLTATDGDGNTSTCVAVVTVLDTISPIANCKADTLYLNASGTASLTASMINDGSSDNCTFTMSVSQSTFTCSDMGVGSATLTVTDASGNTSTCTSSITVMDTLAPMMSCTPVTIYLDAMGMATLTASQVDGGSTDNCGIATMSVSRSSFTCADMGTTTVTLTGTDASGNTSTCTTTVTILDTLAPVVLCKSATVVLDATGTATITTLDVDNGSTDNCGITLSLSNNTFNCTNVGANTVTLTGTDASGNTSSCTATVTVIDNMAPTAICQNITISLDGNGQATILANDIDAGSFDNCTVSGVTVDKTDFDCSNVGRNIVTLTVTDLYRNVSTCTATVTVEDNVAPVVFCPADKNRTVRNTTCTYVVEDFAWETTNTDNCTANGTTTEQFPAAGTEVVAENGRVTITIVTRDASMNADSCTFDVIVNCERELDIPEFISPNGDGMNDYWDLTELSSYTNNVVKLFNRYGTLVFEQRGYTNQFVGRGNVSNSLGEGQLPEGTYFYLIDLGDNNVDKKVYNGYVQIKR